MTDNRQAFKGMSLYTHVGERKYLSTAERKRFLDALTVIKNPAERTFCEMLHWTGCRPSEALALTAVNIDLDEGMVIIRSLKKRGELKGRHFRSIPVPFDFITRLNHLHDIRTAQNANNGIHCKLWDFARTKGWRLTKDVMERAQISGVRGCARGLRHALGVHAAVKHVPEVRLMSWLGHASLETTAIYVNAIGPEDRAIAERMWS